MAATSRGEDISDDVYGIVGNIPPFYHAVDLRNYFSQFLEPGGFKCFHFRHRPETQKRREQVEAPSQSTVKEPKRRFDVQVRIACILLRVFTSRNCWLQHTY